MTVPPELLALARNFEVRPPDADGDVWLVFHGNGTTGGAAINLGKADAIVAQVALKLEEDRAAAIARAEGRAQMPHQGEGK